MNHSGLSLNVKAEATGQEAENAKTKMNQLHETTEHSHTNVACIAINETSQSSSVLDLFTNDSPPNESSETNSVNDNDIAFMDWLSIEHGYKSHIPKNTSQEKLDDEADLNRQMVIEDETVNDEEIKGIQGKTDDDDNLVVVCNTLYDFMKSKNLKKLSRNALEEFTVLKMCEDFDCHSRIVSLTLKYQNVSQTFDALKAKYNDLLKQVTLLKMEVEQTKTLGMAVKITKSVGVQSIPEEMFNTNGKLENLPVLANGDNISVCRSPTIHTSKPLQKTPIVIYPIYDKLKNKYILHRKPSALDVMEEPSSSSVQNHVVMEPPIPNSKAPNVVEKICESNTKQVPHSATRAIENNQLIETHNVPTSINIKKKKQILSTKQQSPSNLVSILRPNTKKRVKKFVPPGMQTKSLQQNFNNIRGSLDVVPSNLGSSVNSTVIESNQANQPPKLPQLLPSQQSGEMLLPKPVLLVILGAQGITLTWRLNEQQPENIVSYQLFTCEENDASLSQWQEIANIKALALPMACTLHHVRNDKKYYFIVRAVYVNSSVGPCSLPVTLFLSKPE